MAHTPPYNPRNKVYVRLDAGGNPIAGTNVTRLKMPKTGSWRQIDANTCCFPYTELTVTPADVTDNDFTLTILCDATTLLTVKVYTTAATTTIDELVDALNTQLSYLGQFFVDGSDIKFKLKLDVSEAWACTGTLSFTVNPT